MLELIFIAALQGISEFLPISSSGHNIVYAQYTQLTPFSLYIDIALHLGSLTALVIFTHKQMANLGQGVIALAKGHLTDENTRFFMLLLMATLPIVIIGTAIVLLGFDILLRNAKWVGVNMIVFGIILYFADRRPSNPQSPHIFGIKQALTLGLWQIMAIFPGASRSGVVITGGRFMGYSRETALRIAMLMGVPTITLSLILILKQAIFTQAFELYPIALAFLFSFVASLVALAGLVKIINSISFMPFILYRICFGVLILSVF